MSAASDTRQWVVVEGLGIQINSAFTSYRLSNKRTLVEIDQSTELPADCRVITKVAPSPGHYLNLRNPGLYLLLKLLRPDNEQLLNARKEDVRIPQTLTRSGPMEYKAKKESFDNLCEALNWLDNEQLRGTTRGSRPVIYGTPGVGKSAFLNHFAAAVSEYSRGINKSLHEELLSRAEKWLQHCVVISVTFNNESQLLPVEEELYASTKLAMRVLWSYFFDFGKGASYEIFVNWLLNLCKQCDRLSRYSNKDVSLNELIRLNQVISLVEKHFEWAYPCSDAASDEGTKQCPYIVLLVDEVTMSVPPLSPAQRNDAINGKNLVWKSRCEASQLLYALKGEVVCLTRLLMVYATVDLLVMHYDVLRTTPITEVQTPRLSKEDVLDLFKPLVEKLSPANRYVVERCLVEANRHPRVLATIFYEVKSLCLLENATFSTELILNNVIDQLNMPRVTAEALALGVLGQHVHENERLHNIVADYFEPKVTDLLAAGVYLSTDSTGYERVTLTPLVVRKAVSDEKLDDEHPIGIAEHSLAYTSPAAMRNLLKQILELRIQFENCAESSNTAGSARDETFARFHYLFELCKLQAHAVCHPLKQYGSTIEKDNYVCASLSEHYQLCYQDDSLPHLGFFATGNLLNTHYPCFLDQELLWPLQTSFKEGSPAHLCNDICTVSRQVHADERDAISLPFYRFSLDFPAIDAAMLVREKGSAQVWCLLFSCYQTDNDYETQQMKRELSAVDVKAKLEALYRCDIVKSFRQCGSIRIVYVLISWLPLSKQLLKEEFARSIPREQRPDSILVLGKEQLDWFYTDSFEPFASFLAGDRIQY